MAGELPHDALMRPKRRNWSASEEDFLRRVYPDGRTSEIADSLGRTVKAVNWKASRMRLRKSREFLLAHVVEAGLVRAGVNSRWRLGQEPWNKGMTGRTTGGESTQFKSGERHGMSAHLWVPIGTERIKHGYLERKVNDGLPRQRRWRPVHVLIWEQANGPVPHGHAVSFLDGDRSNLRLENLRLVTRQELMARNSVYKYGPEIALLSHLRGQISRKLNEMRKNNASKE